MRLSVEACSILARLFRVPLEVFLYEQDYAWVGLGQLLVHAQTIGPLLNLILLDLRVIAAHCLSRHLEIKKPARLSRKGLFIKISTLY